MMEIMESIIQASGIARPSKAGSCEQWRAVVLDAGNEAMRHGSCGADAGSDDWANRRKVPCRPASNPIRALPNILRTIPPLYRKGPGDAIVAHSSHMFRTDDSSSIHLPKPNSQ